MLDSFDHMEIEEPGDERSSLLGGERGGEKLEYGEEEEEFQARSCSEESVICEINGLETMLRKNGSPMSSSPSVEDSIPGFTPTLIGESQMERNEWPCNHLGCGRLFQKRHDLK